MDLLPSARVRKAICVLALCNALAWSGGALADSDTTVNLNIPAQKAVTALDMLAQQTGLSVIYSPDIAEGMETHAVVGTFTVEESVRNLLQGTGLEFEFTGKNTVTVHRPATPRPPAGPDKGKAAPKSPRAKAEARNSERDSVIGASLEEIIVTAEKRDANLQKTGIAITAMSGEDLQRVGVNNLRAAQFMAPGLKIGETQSKTFINMRGVGNELFNAGSDQGVAVHMDGVYLARSEYPSLALMDVERVEVLRGPQGTIYGRNATGGAINIITRKPQAEFDAYTSTTAGNYKSLTESAAIGGTLVQDRVFARLAVFADFHDGWTRNLANGRDLDDTNKHAFRLSLRGIVSDTTEIGLTVNASRDRGNGPASIVLRSATGPGIIWEQFGGKLSTGRNTYSDDPVGLTRDIRGLNFHLSHDFSGATLKTTVGLWKMFSDISDDLDGTSYFTGDEFWAEKQHQHTIEVNLASNNESRLQWLGGVFYFGETAKTFYDAEIAGFGFLGGQSDCCADIHKRGWNTTVGVKSYAAFGQVSYALTDALTAKAGARYTSDHKRERASLAIFGPPLLENLKDSWNNFTPRVALEYQATDAVLLYGSVSKGFKAGGYNVWGLQGSAFKPEKIWSYEVGIKSRFLDNRVQANLTVFHSDYSNLQVNEVLPLAGVRVVNAASARNRGAELEFVARPIEALQLNVSASYLDAKFKSFQNTEVDFPQLGVQDLAGRRLPKAPKFTVDAAGQYSFAIGDAGTVTARLEYNWQDVIYFTEFNRNNAYQPAVGRWNANLAYDSEDGTWSVSGFIKNASNKLVTEGAIIGGQSLGSPVFQFFSPPRLYGVNVTYRIGNR
ncbi:MAG: TonB-dependent receptor [Dehalococcoidia bacterium]